MAGIDFALYVTPDVAAHFDRTAMTDTKVIHRASSRGHLNEGWLDSRHTFSFTDYSDPTRAGFGMLRMLNEDTIAPGAGFPPLEQENMEVVIIPLEGVLEHHDNLGNNTLLCRDQIEVISTGEGVKYYEFNARRDRLAKFLQVWIYPSGKTSPRYAHVKLDRAAMENNLALVVSPEVGVTPAWINQNAWLHMGKLEKGYEFRYRVRSKRNGVYVFLIRGEADVNGEKLRSHDGIGMWDTRCIDIKALSTAEVLLMEVPMV